MRFLKFIFAAVLISIFFVKCKKENEQPKEPNRQPNEFKLTYTTTRSTIELEWTEAVDPDGDKVYYSIYLNGIMLASSLDETRYLVEGLEPETLYEGEIVADDGSNGATSLYFSIYTQQNFPPYDFNVQVEYEGINAIIKWGPVIDPEGDRLRFNVFINEDLYKSGIEDTICSYKIPDFGNNYVGSIEAFDSLGAKTTVNFQFSNSEHNILQWSKTYGGSDDDIAHDVEFLTNGNLLIAGYTNSTDGDISVNKGGEDIWVILLNNQGELIWEKSYGGSGKDIANSIEKTDDGGFILAGYSTSNDGDLISNYGIEDCWIMKLSSLGEIEWQKNFGGSKTDVATEISKTSDGGFIVSGYSNSNDNDVKNSYGNYDCWIIKLDQFGNKEWAKSYGGSEDDKANSIVQNNDGSYTFCGSTKSSDGQIEFLYGMTDYWIVNINIDGDLIWEETRGGDKNEEARTIKSYSIEEYVVAGYMISSKGDPYAAYGSEDFWILMLDDAGKIKWQVVTSTGNTEIPHAISFTNENEILVAGQYEKYVNNIPDEDAAVCKLNSAGTLIWEEKFGGSRDDVCHSIVTNFNDHYLAGWSESDDEMVSSNQGGKDFWILKLNF